MPAAARPEDDASDGAYAGKEGIQRMPTVTTSMTTEATKTSTGVPRAGTSRGGAHVAGVDDGVFSRTVDADTVVGRATSAHRFPGRRRVEVVANDRLAPGVHRLVLHDAYIARHAKPAQFIDLYSANPLRLMPRPLGVCETSGDVASVVFAVVGTGTEEFSRLSPGDGVDVLGPLGRSYDLGRPANYVLVGGGLGVPPLISAAQSLSARDDCRVTALFGYRDARFADDIVHPYADRLESIVNAEGNVIDLLDRLEGELIGSDLPPVILSCGPTPMMKAVAGWASTRGIPCQFSLEQRMGCGYGTCVTCTVDTVEGRLKVCTDGPVFTTERLGWGEAK